MGSGATGSVPTISMLWYDLWIDKQLKSLPPTISERLRSPMEMLEAITEFCQPETSIDDMATHLLALDLIKVDDTKDGGRLVARSIAFAILGWQTLLYQPAFSNCPPQQLALEDVLDGYLGQAYMSLKQDHSRTESCLADFLLGFGLMLPSENLCISDDSEDCLAFEKVAIVGPDDLNAALLKSIAQISIKWVDTLAPHMEFDKATNTLFLFRFPSFCAINLPTEGGSPTRNLLFSCASHAEGPTQWASELDVIQFLHEVLLSYRLLFGQNSKSRRVFQSLIASGSQKPEAEDPLLRQLCCWKSIGLPIQEREYYRLRRDFPILRSRIATLHHQMTSLKPRGWREIWNDKRDSAQWLTFWAVIFIGGLPYRHSLTTNGLLICYAAATGDKLELAATRSGGITELASKLDDSQAQYAYLRMEYANDKENSRVKFALIIWIGESTKVMRKAKVSIQSGEVKRVLHHRSITVDARTKNDLNEDEIVRSSRKADYNGGRG